MSTAPLPIADLLDLVRRTAADPSLWRPHVRFDPASRHWARLPAPSGVDLWLLTWLPAQGTELHDHGQARRGALPSSTARSTELRACARRPRHRRPACQVGTAPWVAPGVVHDVVNHGVASRPSASTPTARG